MKPSDGLFAAVIITVGVTAALAVGAAILSTGSEYILDKIDPVPRGMTREQMYSSKGYQFPAGNDW